MNYPRGLIRYSTENALKNRSSTNTIIRRSLRPRVLIYSAVFFSLLAVTVWSLATRVPLKLDIERDRAVLATEAADGSIENAFQLSLINASEQARTFDVSVTGIDGIHLSAPLQVVVPAAASASATAQVRVEPGALRVGSHPFRFSVVDAQDPTVTVSEEAKFWMR